MDKATRSKFCVYTLHEALCQRMKNRPRKGRGLGHVTHFEIMGPFISSERLKIETSYLVHTLHITYSSQRITN